MASRAFSFDIPKPNTALDSAGGTSLQRRLHAELVARYNAESEFLQMKFMIIL